MALKINVPLNKTTKSSGSPIDGKKIGDDIANAIEKRLTLAFPPKEKKKKEGFFAKTGLKMLGGILAAVSIISVVVSAISDFLKPVFNILKAIMTILFIPLIPILKPVLSALGDLAKGLLPIMIKISKKIEEIVTPKLEALVDKLVNFILVNVDGFVNIFLAMVDLFNTFLGPLSDILLDGILSVLEFFSKHGEQVFQIILDIIGWAGNFLLERWEDIKGILQWASDFLSPVWGVIKEILVSAATTILPKLEKIIISLGNILVDLYNAISTAISKISFGLLGGGKLNKISSSYSPSSVILTNGGFMSSAGQSPFHDFIYRPGSKPVSFSPNDTVIGVKDPSQLGGNTININNPTVRNDQDIQAIANKVSQVLQRQMKGRFSYG